MFVENLLVEQFEEMIKTNDIVFIDFWADPCAPCKIFSPIYEKVASDYKDIMFAKHKIEADKSLSEAFFIQSVPHLIVFKQGIAIYSESGSIPESILRELVQQAIEVDVKSIKAQLDD